MKWHLIVPVSFAVLAVVGGVALAAARHVRGGAWGGDPAAIEKRIEHRLDHVLDELDANDAQRTRAREIVARHAPDLRSLRDHRDSLHAELETLWGGESLDGTALRGVVDRRLEEAREAGYKVADAVAEFHAVFSPAQREKLAELAERRHGHREGCR
jgi:Spy/CpxP family protein refolding chaperone